MTDSERDQQFTLTPLTGLTSYIGRSSLAGAMEDEGYTKQDVGPIRCPQQSYSPDHKALVRQLAKQGITRPEIARRFRMPVSTVHYLVKGYGR